MRPTRERSSKPARQSARDLTPVQSAREAYISRTHSRQPADFSTMLRHGMWCDMKITDIAIHVLKSPLAEPFAFSQGWVRQRSATLVEVLTDDGISGWGEAFAQGLEPPEIAATAIDKALRPLVIGADPLDTEVLWHRMYHMTRDYGRKG